MKIKLSDEVRELFKEPASLPSGGFPSDQRISNLNDLIDIIGGIHATSEEVLKHAASGDEARFSSELDILVADCSWLSLVNNPLGEQSQTLKQQLFDSYIDLIKGISF